MSDIISYLNEKCIKNISENIYEFFNSDNEKENILLYNIEVVRLILEEYEQAKAEGLNPPLPLAGIILHSAVHSGKNKRLFII